MNSRDIDILKHILRYCDEIDEANSFFGATPEKLKSSRIYKNAVAMCILQIGELTTHLSESFKAEYNKMPWQDIKGMRNIAAHKYGSFDVNMLWDTITEDIPALKEYCALIIEKQIS